MKRCYRILRHAFTNPGNLHQFVPSFGIGLFIGLAARQFSVAARIMYHGFTDDNCRLPEIELVYIGLFHLLEPPETGLSFLYQTAHAFG